MDNNLRMLYARNIALEEIGEEGQQRLCDAGVLIIGAGALGSVAAMYLAGAGVGRIAIVDFDTIDLSNLQRQVHYNHDDPGLSKAQTLAKRVKALNPNVTVVAHNEAFSRFLAPILIPSYDVVLECTDNAPTKQMVAECAAAMGKPCVSGGVTRWHGQVLTMIPGSGSADFSEIFGDVSKGTGCGITGCAEGGVAGPCAGIIADVQALQAIRIICGLQEQSALTVYDTLSMRTLPL